MHELHFLTNLVRMIEEEMSQRHGVPVVIRLQVASDSHLIQHSVETLQTMFQFVARGTCAHQARLDVLVQPVRGQCRICGTSVECRDDTIMCPSCGMGPLEREHRAEAVIKEIEYVDNDSSLE
ncbi:MAG: hydrogenase maturation nickel metallochaperone HypA [Nitrospirae bacterium]|nr:MAG: hydrogenase maturation nickel metallochaperone HypA [Nitrospirota bacterium]